METVYIMYNKTIIIITQLRMLSPAAAVQTTMECKPIISDYNFLIAPRVILNIFECENDSDWH